MTRLRVKRLVWPVTVLGPGRRAGVWTQGCTIGCAGCASVDTWDPEGGYEIDVDRLLDWIAGLAPDGVTITGGEPFQQPLALERLVDGIRALPVENPADVLAYSGYVLRRLQRDEALWAIARKCDAVVTGPYSASAGPGGWLRGSANQELVTMTELGQARYADEPAGVDRLQVDFSGGRVTLLGVPRPGDLDRMARKLEESGLPVTEATWRT